MFLYLLNKVEQENFLELAAYAIELDTVGREQEAKILESYKYECQLIDYKIKKQDAIEDVIDFFKLATKKTKKIILLEFIGILLADGTISEEESTFLDKLSLELDVDNYEVKKTKRWVEAMNDIVKEGYLIISK